MELASLQEKLKEEGWNLSESGIGLLSENGKITDVKTIIKKAIDVDLKSISQGALPEDINRTKYEEIPGNMVLQIQKVKNISNPKSNDANYQSSNILKLNLTDGVQNVQAIQMEAIQEIHPNTFPGSKIHITSENVNISHTYLQLFSHNTRFLGGKVETLVEKWELNKRLAKHKRDGMGENGPPPWIGFGRKVVKQTVTDKNFKSLDQAKNKDSAAENSEFEAQRKDAILEATKIGCTKVFGGGNKQLLDYNVQQIVDAGFSIDDAEYALRISKNNLEKALKTLQNKKSSKDENSKTNGGNEEKKSVKSRGRNRDDELVNSLKPSGKVSLFEFLEDKLPIQDPPIETKPVHERRNGNQQNFYHQASKPNSRPNIRGNTDRSRPRHTLQTEYEDRRPVDYRDKPDPRHQRKNYDSFRTFSKSDYTDRRSYPEKKPDFGKFENQRNSNRSFDGGFRWDKFRTDFGNYKGNRDMRNGDYTSKNEFYKNKSLDKRGQVNTNPSAIKSQGRPMDLNENNNSSSSSNNNNNNNNNSNNNNNNNNSNNNNNGGGGGSGVASNSSKKSSGYMPVTERPPRFQKHQNQTNDSQASAQNWSDPSYNRIPQTDFQLQNSMANLTLQQSVPNYQSQNTQEGYTDILTTVVTPTNTKPNNLFFQNIVNQTSQSNDNRILVSQNSQPPPPPPPSHQSHIDTYGNRNVGTFIPQEVKNSTYTNIPNLHDVAFKNNGPLLHGYSEFQSVYAQPRAPSNSYPNTAYLTGPNGLPPQTQKAWIWSKGDKCMARYWEDQMYYNAVVTAVSENTCVVRFTDYGNYEEVLQDHCIPITES